MKIDIQHMLLPSAPERLATPKAKGALSFVRVRLWESPPFLLNFSLARPDRANEGRWGPVKKVSKNEIGPQIRSQKKSRRGAIQ